MLNIEKYKDKILEYEGIEQLDCILCDLRNGKCDDETCEECRKKSIEWMFKECKPFKMTQFEYDLIKTISKTNNRPVVLEDLSIIEEMFWLGHFKGIDLSLDIGEILEQTEIVDEV